VIARDPERQKNWAADERRSVQIKKVSRECT
jgi:hypothetical protein